MLELLGDENAEKSDNAAADLLTHTMQLSTGQRELSWAMYGFGGLEPTDVPELLTVNMGIYAPSVVWIALSDYAALKWHWYRFEPGSGVVQLSITDGERLVNSAGTCYAVAAVWDGEQATLASLQLAYRHTNTNPLGEWPMCGYDSQHSGRSPHTGPDMPELKWSLNLGAESCGGLTISNDGVVYATSMIDSASIAGKLSAVSPGGVILWEYPVDDAIVSYPAIGQDGAIYLGCWDHYFYAVNPDGTLRWKYDTGEIVFSSPVIGADGRIYLTSGTALLCFLPDGTLAWALDVGSESNTPAIAADGTIFTTSGPGAGLCAVNADGSVKWQSEDVFANSAVSLGPDGTVYCSSMQAFFAVSAEGKWKWVLADLTFDENTPTSAADGTLYLIRSGAHAINPDGTVKWTYNPQTGTSSQRIAVDASGTLYFGTGFPSAADPGTVFALNPDGTEKWCWDSAVSISSDVVIGAGHMLYVGDRSGRLLALGPQ